MSYTSLYGIKSDFTAVELKQYKNSWLFLPQHFSQGAHDFSHWGEWRL